MKGLRFKEYFSKETGQVVFFIYHWNKLSLICMDSILRRRQMSFLSVSPPLRPGSDTFIPVVILPLAFVIVASVSVVFVSIFFALVAFVLVVVVPVVFVFLSLSPLVRSLSISYLLRPVCAVFLVAVGN